MPLIDTATLLQALHSGDIRLEIADDGRGLGTTARGTGFGSRLIAMMADRLGAQHAWHDACPGTRFVMDVPRL
ncbi:hypothetical protein [Sphingomonas sp. OTU376]|uniref:hypothetical protein n=1 Tax=Sphingomonas sp. OTU376 TaxID=3043863 RepID=UPI00313BC04E